MMKFFSKATNSGVETTLHGKSWRHNELNSDSLTSEYRIESFDKIDRPEWNHSGEIQFPLIQSF